MCLYTKFSWSAWKAEGKTVGFPLGGAASCHVFKKGQFSSSLWEPVENQPTWSLRDTPCYGSPWIIIPAVDTRACSWETLASFCLEVDGISACRGAPLGYGPADCLHSALCWEGGGTTPCEMSREFRTATQRQDLSGVAVQAVCVWEYLVLKCLKMFSLKMVTSDLCFCLYMGFFS